MVVYQCIVTAAETTAYVTDGSHLTNLQVSSLWIECVSVKHACTATATHGTALENEVGTDCGTELSLTVNCIHDMLRPFVDGAERYSLLHSCIVLLPVLGTHLW